MNDLEFTFETAPWEQVIARTDCGGELDGVQFLALMEQESEEDLEDALLLLDEKDILLNIDGLSAFAVSGEMAVRLRLEQDLVKRNALMKELEENDPLRLYLEEIAALPACGDAQQLAEQYRAGREEVLPQLTNLMLSKVAEQAFALAGRGVLLMDLLQEGGLGLWQAVLTYQVGDFETYCARYIQRALNKALVIQAREYGVGQKMRQAMEDYRCVDERLLGELGRNATVEEIAEQLHMSVEETVAVARMISNARLVDKAKPSQEPEEEDIEEARHVEDTAFFQMRQRILDLLSCLCEEDAKLLTLRFGLEGGMPLTPEDAGRKLGLTPEEVVAREAKALAQLRNS